VASEEWIRGLITRHSSLATLVLALFRRHGEKGRSFLFDLLALAFRAGHATFIVLMQGHDHREGFFALFADELVVGHKRYPPATARPILTK
jgi:hypothetical protein